MKSFHMRIDVKNILLLSPKDFRKNWKNVFCNEDGTPMTYEEARGALADELAKGHIVIPVGECDNFDYLGKGCLGHEEGLS